MKDFAAWIEECSFTRKHNAKDMIEFLYQKGFINGKKWNKYINNIAEGNKRFLFWVNYEPMEEGKIPPDAWV